MKLFLKRICFRSSVVFPFLNCDHLIFKVEISFTMDMFQTVCGHTDTHTQKQSYIQARTRRHNSYMHIIYITDLMHYVKKNVSRSIFADSPYQPSRRMRGGMTTSCSRPFVGCPFGLYAWSICLHSHILV